MYETLTPAAAPPVSAPPSPSASSRLSLIGALMRDVDGLMVRLVRLVGLGGVEAVSGLEVEQALSLATRWTRSDTRSLVFCAETLKRFPRLATVFEEGLVSWGSVRSLCSLIKSVRAADREGLDGFVEAAARRLWDADPWVLTETVSVEVDRLREDLLLAREDRTLKRSGLYVQQRFDGGVQLSVSADPVSAATILEALDAFSDAPVKAIDPADWDEEGPDRSRASQHFEALLSICEHALGCPGQHRRPKARLYATVNLDALSGAMSASAGYVLASVAGKPMRLSRVAAEELLCDADVTPMVFDEARPVAVGDSKTRFSGKVRAAMVARDKHCRFCGDAPAVWGDAHHVDPGVGNQASDGCLLCRRCHRRVHREGWTGRVNADATITWRRRNKQFTSHPPP